MPRSDSTELKRAEPGQYEKEKKTIIDSPFQLAFFRGLIYLFSGLISVFLIIVNLKGVNIGPALKFGSWTTTYSLAAFQVAAKVQVWRTRDHVYLRELTIRDGNF